MLLVIIELTMTSQGTVPSPFNIKTVHKETHGIYQRVSERGSSSYLFQQSSVEELDGDCVVPFEVPLLSEFLEHYHYLLCCNTQLNWTLPSREERDPLFSMYTLCFCSPVTGLYS